LRVGVVGVSGFIGSHLFDGLSSLHSIKGFSSSFSDEYKKIQKGDYFNNEDIQLFCNNLDTLIYAAGMVNPRFSTDENLEKAIKQQIHQLDLWLEIFFKKNPDGKLILFSSSGALYPKSFEKIYDESDSLDPQGCYGMLKFGEENLIINKYFKHKIVILRPSNVYGDPFKKNIHTGIIDRLIYASINGGVINIFDNQLNRRDYLYIEDLIHAVGIVLGDKLFFQTTGIQVFNLCSQISLTIEEVIFYVRKHFGDVELVYSNQDVAINALFLSSKKFRLLTNWKPRNSFEDSLQKIKQKISRDNNGKIRLI